MTTENWIYEWVGRRIKSLREETPLSQEDLAKRIKMTRNSITQIEKGTQGVQLDTLYAIAEVLRVHPCQLIPPPREPMAIPQELLKGYSKAERIWIESVLSYQPIFVKGQGNKIIKLRRNTEESLENIFAAGWKSDPPVDVEEIANKCGAEVQFAPADGEISGLLYNLDDRVVIGVNSLHPRVRQRFTVAHMIGHLALHDVRGLHLDRNFTGAGKTMTLKRRIVPVESEANDFAYRLLIPTVMLHDETRSRVVDPEDVETINRLADRFKVSPGGVHYRLSQVYPQDK